MSSTQSRIAIRHNPTPTYQSWRHIFQRCYNPKHNAYNRYGGRGIKVCDRWLESYENFLLDMGERPIGMYLDRIDNNGDYTPENCRWATPKEQARNKRNNHLLTYNGETRCLAEWAEITGIHPQTLINRIRNGWDVPKALTVTICNDD
jgi:hypothetical protein